MAKLVFLGRLEDMAGAAELPVPLSLPASLASVIAALPVELAVALTGPRVRIAVNGALVRADDAGGVTLAEGDEVAFLPPVSGGSA